MPFLQDARGFSQAALRGSDAPATCAYAAAAGADRSSSTFWNICAGSVYAAKCSRQKPELASSSANPNGLASLSLLSSRHYAVSTGATLRNNAIPSLRSLPCPTLYQAKEPEAISDVFRRAGKKALGGGIPGEV